MRSKARAAAAVICSGRPTSTDRAPGPTSRAVSSGWSTKRALELGRAEGLLVYGERLVDRIPEDRARAVHGADPETVIVFQVERRGDEFWARWGKKAAATVGS